MIIPCNNISAFVASRSKVNYKAPFKCTVARKTSFIRFDIDLRRLAK